MRADSVGARIKVAREAAGFVTARAFARALGTAPAQVSRWEHGRVLPGARWMQQIARVTGARFEWIAMGVGAPPIEVQRTGTDD